MVLLLERLLGFPLFFLIRRLDWQGVTARAPRDFGITGITYSEYTSLHITHHRQRVTITSNYFPSISLSLTCLCLVPDRLTNKAMFTWKSCQLLLVVATLHRVEAFGVQLPKQKCLSSSTTLSMDPVLAPFENEEDHLKNQAAAFDGMAPMFSRSDGLPADTAAVVDHIATTFLHEIVENRKKGAAKRGEEEPTNFRLLDIGCGAGVLLRFFLNEANKMGITLEIVGLDVSEQMITFGKGHALNVLRDVGDQHKIEMFCDDFINYLDGNDGQFDGAIANSCFANFFDTNAAIKSMTDGIREDGILCVAHPVGSEFVQGLHDMNPLVTPHLMPTESEFAEMTSPYPLKNLEFYEHMEYNDMKRPRPLYYASAVKVAEE